MKLSEKLRRLYKMNMTDCVLWGLNAWILMMIGTIGCLIIFVLFEFLSIHKLLPMIVWIIFYGAIIIVFAFFAERSNKKQQLKNEQEKQELEKKDNEWLDKQMKNK